MAKPFRFVSLDPGRLTGCASEQCVRRMTCKRAREHDNGEYSHLSMFFLSAIEEEDGSECMFYVIKETLIDEGKVFRGKARRHNRHAPPPGSVRPREPDLMVKRHIREGKDINDD